MISHIFTLSIELSKNRIVNIRNHTIIIPNVITENCGAKDNITPEKRRPRRNPIPDIILLRARIFAYSLGFACESI